MAQMSREIAEQVMKEFEWHLESLQVVRNTRYSEQGSGMKGAVDREFQRFYSEIQLLTGIKKNGYLIVEEARGVLGIKLTAKEEYERLVERPGLGMSRPPKFTGGWSTGGGLPGSKR